MTDASGHYIAAERVLARVTTRLQLVLRTLYSNCLNMHALLSIKLPLIVLLRMAPSGLLGAVMISITGSPAVATGAAPAVHSNRRVS